jgi:hypothetical protein
MHTVILAALFLAGCAASNAQRSGAPAPPPAVNAPVAAQSPVSGSDDDAVRLAVFRYLHHNTSDEAAPWPFVCLEISQGDRLSGLEGQVRDPSRFIMAAMSGLRPPAVPASACEVDPPRGVFLKDDRAKGYGVIFFTEEVKIDGDKATVTGGYYEANLSAGGGVYTVERQSDGSWQVTHSEQRWESGLDGSCSRSTITRRAISCLLLAWASSSRKSSGQL